MKHKILLRRLNNLEKSVFDKSISTLLNRKSGVLVVDDKLISSGASDVKTKAISSRKIGKKVRWLIA